jgi:hypothetical protein
MRNGVAERHALLRIGEPRLERSLRNARGLRADTNAPAIKRGEGNLVALAYKTCDENSHIQRPGYRFENRQPPGLGGDRNDIAVADGDQRYKAVKHAIEPIHPAIPVARGVHGKGAWLNCLQQHVSRSPNDGEH